MLWRLQKESKLFWYCEHILYRVKFSFDTTYWLRTTDDQQSSLFSSKFRTLGRQIGQINSESIWGIFGWTTYQHPFRYSESTLSIIQPLFLQNTKPLYPDPKHLFGIGMWIWAAKNYGFSLFVSVVRAKLNSKWIYCWPDLTTNSSIFYLPYFLK